MACTTRRRAALAGITIGAALAMAPSALGTFPGDNGVIAFTRDGDIYTVNPDGTGERRLTSGAAQDRVPEWTPDGRSIFFNRDGEIYRMKADGFDLTHIAAGGSPQVSADGKRLAYDRGEEVVIRDLASGAETVLADEINLSGVDDWAPTHSLLLYTLSDGDSSFIGRSPEGAVASWGYLHDDRHLNSVSPSWSPEGTRLAFVRDHSGIGPCNPGDPTCPFDPDIGLVTMDIGGGGYRVVHDRGRQPAWSPDGERIVYVNSGTLQVIRADGSGRKTLVKGSSPDWQPVAPKPPEPKVIEVPGPERVVTVQVPVPGPVRVVEKVVTRTVQGARECKVPKTEKRFTLTLRTRKAIRAGTSIKVRVDLAAGRRAKVAVKGKQLRIGAWIG